MYKISTKELKETCSLLNAAHKPLMFFGTYGIGKSEMIFQWSAEQAKRESRTFLDWNRSTQEMQDDALAHPEQYYVFIDIRISQLDAGDLRGIPLISNTSKDYLQLITLRWINYITKKDASGCVFFDEINLAMPTVTASAYAIINDRVISDRSISNKVFICAAGNTIEDTDMVQVMSKPLLDRFAVAELMLDKSYWLEYAISHINPYLYAFCDWDKDYIHKRAKTDGMKDVTPRGISNASLLLNEVDFKDSGAVYKAIALCVGEDFATRFKAYYEHVRALNWDELFEDPSKIKDMNIDIKYAAMGAIVSELKACSENATDTKNLIDKIYNYLVLTCNFPSDYVMAMLKQCNSFVPKCFEEAQKGKETTTKVTLLTLIYKICILGKIKGIDDKTPKAKKQVDELFKIFKKDHYDIFEKLTHFITV